MLTFKPPGVDRIRYTEWLMAGGMTQGEAAAKAVELDNRIAGRGQMQPPPGDESKEVRVGIPSIDQEVSNRIQPAPIMSLKGSDWTSYYYWLISPVGRNLSHSDATEFILRKKKELGMDPYGPLNDEGIQFQPPPGDEPVVEPKEVRVGIPMVDQIRPRRFERGDQNIPQPILEFRERDLEPYYKWLTAPIKAGGRGLSNEEAEKIVAQMQPESRKDDEFRSGRGSFAPPRRDDEEAQKLLYARGTFKQDDEMLLAASGGRLPPRAGGRRKVQYSPPRRIDEEANKLLYGRGTTPKEKRDEKAPAENTLDTPENVQKFFREAQDYAILTATREAAGAATAEENLKANNQLYDELVGSGYKSVIPIGGAYKGVDQGENFLVTGIKPKEALALGQRYGQESVVVKDGLLHSADESIIPSRLENIITGPEAEKLDYFSTLPNKISFSIPFDFDAERVQAQFTPKRKEDPLKFHRTQFGDASKAWILPDGTVEQLGAEWHHQWLDRNKEIQTKYGLKIPPFEATDATGVRESALKKGFARANLSDGLIIEMREKDWHKYRPLVEDLIERNLDAIDKLRIYLFDESIKEIQKSYAAMLFDLDTKKQKMAKVYETFSDDAQRELSGQFNPSRSEPDAIFSAAVKRKSDGEIFKGLTHGEALRKSGEKTDIAVTDGFVDVSGKFYDRKQAFQQAVKMGQIEPDMWTPRPGMLESVVFERSQGAQWSPKRTEQGRKEQQQLFGGRELLSTTEIAGMSRKELREHFPEAVVPADLKEALPSKIVESPLHKKSDDPVGAFADKLVDFAKQYEDNPLFQSGKRWYSEFTPLLKKYFGTDAPLMAELLAATSPQTPPGTNFGYALDALEGLKSGRFKKIIAKFNEGMKLLNSGAWEKTADTPARFMADWVEKYDLKPRQSNGRLYGQHSRPVLQVFARIWLADNRGPKTANFVENLLGTSDEATIDLWADRTMRRIGYEGAQERWRILPQNGTSVADADFAFAQKAFRAAADQLSIKPSELQGALWFAEKSLWNENGWARLDLGDYRREIQKTDLLRRGVQHRTAAAAAEKKTRPAEEIELPLVEKRKLR